LPPNGRARATYLANLFFAERAGHIGTANVFDQWSLDARGADPKISTSRTHKLGGQPRATKGAGWFSFYLIHNAGLGLTA
jgi:hypothetical protein